MPYTVNKFDNLFTKEQKSWNEHDLQEYILGKIFPSIRYGQDSDLERYVKTRESSTNSSTWQQFYDNLSIKYTEPERKHLIHSMRKSIHNFNLVFRVVINNLYKRVIKSLKKRIDLLNREFNKIEQLAKAKFHKDHNMLKRVENIIQLCSQNKSDALEGINFLEDIAQNLSYKQTMLKKIQHLVKGYFDGTLFEEAIAKIEYHFDIKEEYRKQKKLSAKKADEDIRLKIFITREDIEKILVNEKKFNEYELAFFYLEKYIRLLDDPEFATKIYVYSKKHNSPHYHIFDVIRKGALYNYQKNRVFDDIFKIICQGRYVFNITNEKQIDRKLKVLGKPVKLAVPPPKVRITKPIPEQLPAKQEKNQDKGAVPQKIKAHRVRERARRESGRQKKKKTIPRSLHTIAEMIQDIADNQKTFKILQTEFIHRLPGELTKQLGFSNSNSLDDEHKMKQLKELIRYVLQNYDSILSQESMFSEHQEKIQRLGFSLHSIYTVILNCFNNLKSDFLTGELRQKLGRSPFRRFQLF
jgi:hypothetical protein